MLFGKAQGCEDSLLRGDDMFTNEWVSWNDESTHRIGHKVDLGLGILVFDGPDYGCRKQDVAELAELNNEDFQAWQSPLLARVLKRPEPLKGPKVEGR